MSNKKGFTLVELLIVVVILAILFLMAVVRATTVLTRAREAKTKDYLANVRVAINNYYSTNQGIHPVNLDDKPDVVGGQPVPAFQPNYMNEIPNVRIRSPLPHSSNTNNVKVIDTQKNMITTGVISDEGGWIYSSTTGEIRVNCNHIDSREEIYYSNYGHEDK